MLFLEGAVTTTSILQWLKLHVRSLIITGVIIIITVILLIIIKFVAHRMKKKNNRSYTVAKLIQSILNYAVIIVAIFAVLSSWGIDVTAALAGVGVLSLIIGLGAQDLIKDFLAGIGIVFEDQYEIDDVVEIDGFKGKVTEIGLRTTKLISFNVEIRIIRNGQISQVSNFSRSYSLAVVVVNVAYKENIDKVITLLDEKLPSLKENYKQIIEGPIVAGVEDLKDSSVAIRITAKTESEEHYAVERALKKFVKEVFDENNVEIPFPQIVVHGDKNE